MPPTNTAGANAVAAQRQFLVTIEGIAGTFATKTGGETSADTSDVYDGGKKHPEKLASPATTDNVTVSRPFRPARDGALAKRLRPLVGSYRSTVTVQPTDADLIPVGAPTVYANALLVRLADPEHDAASGDSSTIELEFAVETVA